MFGYILAFIAGVVAGNGVPHFVKGITGARHQTPFGRPSGAVANALWGSANFVAAVWLSYWASTFAPAWPLASTVGILGSAAAATALAFAWRTDPVARGEHPRTQDAAGQKPDAGSGD